MSDGKKKWTWPWQIGRQTEAEQVTKEVEIIQEATLASERADKVAEELQEELATLTDNRITNHYAPAVIAAWQPNAQAAARRAAT